MAVFNGNLGEALEAHQIIPLDYSSDLRDLAGIANLFHHQEYRDKIIDIIQKRFPIPPVTNRRGNHEFLPICYYPTWKPQISQGEPQFRSFGKINGKRY